MVNSGLTYNYTKLPTNPYQGFDHEELESLHESVRESSKIDTQKNVREEEIVIY